MDNSTRQITTELTAGAAGIGMAMAAGMQAARQHGQDRALARSIERHNAAVIRSAASRVQARHAAEKAALLRELAAIRSRIARA